MIITSLPRPGTKSPSIQRRRRHLSRNRLAVREYRQYSRDRTRIEMGVLGNCVVELMKSSHLPSIHPYDDERFPHRTREREVRPRLTISRKGSRYRPEILYIIQC